MTNLSAPQTEGGREPQALSLPQNYWMTLDRLGTSRDLGFHVSQDVPCLWTLPALDCRTLGTWVIPRPHSSSRPL